MFEDHHVFIFCPPQGGLLSALGSLAMMMWLAMTPHNSETERKRLTILAGFAFLTGRVMMMMMIILLARYFVFH